MGRYRRLRIIAAIALSLACGGAPAEMPGKEAQPVPAETTYRMAPFGDVAVYRPEGEPKGVALFLSGDGGWNIGVVEMARAYASQGLLVAGVSTAALMTALEQGTAKCINPNYPLVDLARDVQHRMGVRAYMKPIIIGYSSGATVAYAGLAQWPNGGYRGVVSMGFGADLPGHKPWCAAPGFSARPVTKPDKGWLFAPSRKIKVPWVVMEGQKDEVVDPTAARRFAAAVPGARIIELPTVGHGFAVQSQWLPQMSAAIAAMLPPPPALPPAPGAVAISDDMPLNIVPAKGGRRPGTMAVIYSGDGGWVGIDRDVAGQLSAAGIPVVGVDSLSYFWSQRTPAGAGADLSRVIIAFSQRWNRPRVILIGYSFGADTLPYIVGKLDPAARAKVASLSLLGLSPSADFQFHLSSWLDISSAQAMPTLPAVTRLKGMTIRCVRGVAENDSACPTLPQRLAQQYVVPGGHHFDRNAALLARIILGMTKPAVVR